MTRGIWTSETTFHSFAEAPAIASTTIEEALKFYSP